VMPGTVGASPDAAVSVGTFCMVGIAKTFSNQAPLGGKIGVGIIGECLIDGPACRDMVEDYAVAVASPCGVIVSVFGAVGPLVAEPAANIADDDVIIAGVERAVCDADAVAGCGLAGDGYVGIFDIQIGCKMNGSGHAKDNCARGIVIESVAE